LIEINNLSRQSSKSSQNIVGMPVIQIDSVSQASSIRKSPENEFTSKSDSFSSSDSQLSSDSASSTSNAELGETKENFF